MNCNQVQAVLAVLRPESRDGELPEFAAEMSHLQQCATCQAQWELQQQSDRELSRAIREVSIPTDLTARLLAQLAAANNPVESASIPSATTVAIASPATTAEQPPSSARKTVYRRIVSVVSAAMVLLALGGWWLLQPPRQIQLPVAKLLVLSHTSVGVNSPAFQQTFRPDLPVSEIRMPANPMALRPLSLRSDGREIGALFSYQVPGTRRGKPLTVVLVVIDLKQVAVPDLASIGTSFQAAGVDYPEPHKYATRVWRGGEKLYICYVQSHNPEDLDSLKMRYQQA